MGELVKAVIETLQGTKRTVKALFNPKEYTLSKSVSWNQHKNAATDFPNMQFTTGQPKKLQVDLFFDGYDSDQGATVRSACQNLIAMAEMDPDLHHPPKCQFSWGGLVFKGVMDNVTVRYTMFDSKGQPVRATATISMSAGSPTRKDPDPDQKDNKSSPDVAKLHTLKRGETLNAIAEAEYADPGEWRRIADANGIDNPMDLVPGDKLIIPPILDRHGAGG